MAFSLRTSNLGRRYENLLQHRLLPRLKERGVTPNQLTMTGCALAAFVPFGFKAHPFFGLLLMLLSGLADSLDGLMARRLQRESRFGAFLDSSLDRLSDFFYLCGFWVLFWSTAHERLAGLVIFSAMLATVMVSYVKARAEALGITCQAGLMERGVRVVYQILWAVLVLAMPGQRGTVLWLGLSLYLGLTLATVLQRILLVRGKLQFGKR
jgi:phosphatidylglycerophosphate synthase